MNAANAAQELVTHYQALARLGLNEQSSGNISCRVDGGMLISPSGASADHFKPADAVHMDLSGEVHGDGTPSSEWQMHAAVYQRVPTAAAVVHTHSDHCVALASHGRPLPGFHYLVGTLGGTDVPCVPYLTFGTSALGEAAAHTLEQRLACLLGSHGAISRGRTLASAVTHAHRLETLCRHYHLACRYGDPYLLSDAEWQEFFAQADRYGYREAL